MPINPRASDAEEQGSEVRSGAARLSRAATRCRRRSERRSRGDATEHALRERQPGGECEQQRDNRHHLHAVQQMRRLGEVVDRFLRATRAGHG